MLIASNDFLLQLFSHTFMGVKRMPMLVPLIWCAFDTGSVCMSVMHGHLQG